MKFTKLSVVALLLALLVCAFVACGGPAETETETETEAETNAPATEAETEPETEGETEHVHDLELVVTPATCTSRGYERQICKTCGSVEDTKPIPITDHTPAAPATCTENSVCSVCATVIETATGHNYGEATITTEATCSAEGSKTQTCATCNDVLAEAIAKLDHAIATPTETKASTISEKGYVKGLCSMCNAEVTNETPAGIVLNIEALEDGILPDGFTAAAGFDMFYGTVDEPTTAIIAEKTEANGEPYLGAPGDWATVVTDPETGNKYIIKPEGYPVDAGIFFEDTAGILNGATVEISFDYRCDGDTKNNGLISLNNREVAKTDEMRILSLWSGNKIVFASNSSMTVAKVDTANPQWFNFRIIADTKTLSYEVYVDGVKKIYTEYDENNNPTAYCLQDDGTFKAYTDGFGSQSPYHSDDGIIKGIYFWHYNYPAGALDNVKVAILTPAE